MAILKTIQNSNGVTTKYHRVFGLRVNKGIQTAAPVEGEPAVEGVNTLHVSVESFVDEEVRRKGGAPVKSRELIIPLSEEMFAGVMGEAYGEIKKASEFFWMRGVSEVDISKCCAK